MNVLVVEDDENSRVLQHTILEAAGHAVQSAGNGREALQGLARSRPDVIISDIMMPELDGYALCRAVKSDPALAAIPFVFYTATYTSPADQQLALELGGARFLTKPMDPDAFLAEISGVFATRDRAAPPPQPPLDLKAVDVRYAQTIARKLDKKMEELKATRTQLTDAEIRLRQIEESYRMAQRIAGIGSWDLDLASGTFWWTDELYNLLGRDPGPEAPDRAALLGRIAAGDRERFERALHLAETKGIPFRMEHRILGRGDGARLALSEAKIAAKDADTGRPTRITCAMQDITRQRQMEEEKARLELSLRQAQKMQALGTLAGSIAHDFNNILTTIVASAELLQTMPRPLSDEERDFLGQIIQAGRRAADLVDQIRTFGRQGEQTKQPVDLAPLVEEVCAFARRTAPASIELQARQVGTCPPVLANPTQMHQVIMNLCVNACHAMRQQGGRLDLELDAVTVQSWDDVVLEGLKPGRYVRLTVRDTGCGIDDATRERIFEPYFTTKEPEEGTGLGLSVVHGIVLGHNGLITVESAVGKGTTFLVHLPVA